MKIYKLLCATFLTNVSFLNLNAYWDGSAVCEMLMKNSYESKMILYNKGAMSAYNLDEAFYKIDRENNRYVLRFHREKFVAPFEKDSKLCSGCDRYVAGYFTDGGLLIPREGFHGDFIIRNSNKPVLKDGQKDPLEGSVQFLGRVILPIVDAMNNNISSTYKDWFDAFFLARLRGSSDVFNIGSDSSVEKALGKRLATGKKFLSDAMYNKLGNSKEVVNAIFLYYCLNKIVRSVSLFNGGIDVLLANYDKFKNCTVKFVSVGDNKEKLSSISLEESLIERYGVEGYKKKLKGNSLIISSIEESRKLIDLFLGIISSIGAYRDTLEFNKMKNEYFAMFDNSNEAIKKSWIDGQWLNFVDDSSKYCGMTGMNKFTLPGDDIKKDVLAYINGFKLVNWIWSRNYRSNSGSNIVRECLDKLTSIQGIDYNISTDVLNHQTFSDIKAVIDMFSLTCESNEKTNNSDSTDSVEILKGINDLIPKDKAIGSITSDEVIKIFKQMFKYLKSTKGDDDNIVKKCSDLLNSLDNLVKCEDEVLKINDLGGMTNLVFNTLKDVYEVLEDGLGKDDFLASLSYANYCVALNITDKSRMFAIIGVWLNRYVTYCLSELWKKQPKKINFMSKDCTGNILNETSTLVYNKLSDEFLEDWGNSSSGGGLFSNFTKSNVEPSKVGKSTISRPNGYYEQPKLGGKPVNMELPKVEENSITKVCKFPEGLIKTSWWERGKDVISSENEFNFETWKNNTPICEEKSDMGASTLKEEEKEKAKQKKEETLIAIAKASSVYKVIGTIFDRDISWQDMNISYGIVNCFTTNVPTVLFRLNLLQNSTKDCDMIPYMYYLNSLDSFKNNFDFLKSLGDGYKKLSTGELLAKRMILRQKYIKGKNKEKDEVFYPLFKYIGDVLEHNVIKTMDISGYLLNKLIENGYITCICDKLDNNKEKELAKCISSIYLEFNRNVNINLSFRKAIRDMFIRKGENSYYKLMENLEKGASEFLIDGKGYAKKQSPGKRANIEKFFKAFEEAFDSCIEDINFKIIEDTTNGNVFLDLDAVVNSLCNGVLSKNRKLEEAFKALLSDSQHIDENMIGTVICKLFKEEEVKKLSYLNKLFYCAFSTEFSDKNNSTCCIIYDNEKNTRRLFFKQASNEFSFWKLTDKVYGQLIGAINGSQLDKNLVEYLFNNQEFVKIIKWRMLMDIIVSNEEGLENPNIFRKFVGDLLLNNLNSLGKEEKGKIISAMNEFIESYRSNDNNKLGPCKGSNTVGGMIEIGDKIRQVLNLCGIVDSCCSVLKTYYDSQKESYSQELKGVELIEKNGVKSLKYTIEEQMLSRLFNKINYESDYASIKGKIRLNNLQGKEYSGIRKE